MARSPCLKRAPLLHPDDAGQELFLRASGKNPMIGQGAEEHGLWSLLWEDHPYRTLIPSFRTLQRHAALSQMAVMRYWTERPEWQPRVSPATTLRTALYVETLSIRHFVMAAYKNRAEYLTVLAQIPAVISAADLISSLGADGRTLHSISTRRKACKHLQGSLHYRLVVEARRGARQVAPVPNKPCYPHPDPINGMIATDPVAPVPSPEPSIEYVLDRSPLDDLDEELSRGDLEDETNGNIDDDENEGEPSITSAAPGVYHRYCWSPTEVDDCLNSGTHPADELPKSSIYLSHPGRAVPGEAPTGRHRGTRSCHGPSVSFHLNWLRMACRF